MSLRMPREQIDVAIDQIQPTFVGLAAQAGRDANQIAAGDVFVAAGNNPLIGHDAGAVQQVEGLPAHRLGIHIQQRDLADHAAHLQGKRRARTDEPGSANNADFHRSADF